MIDGELSIVIIGEFQFLDQTEKIFINSIQCMSSIIVHFSGSPGSFEKERVLTNTKMLIKKIFYLNFIFFKIQNSVLYFHFKILKNVKKNDFDDDN